MAAVKRVAMYTGLILFGLNACGKDAAMHEKELRMQIAAATRMIENYKSNKYDGVEDLEKWKSDMETELQELTSKR